MQEIQYKNDSLNEKVEELRDRLELTEHLKGTLEKDLEVTKEKLAEAQQKILSKKMALEVDDQVRIFTRIKLNYFKLSRKLIMR